MARQKRSYFEEKRDQHTDPNFFKRGEMKEDLSRNLKRVLKDIAIDLMNPEDYIYFTNKDIIYVCIDTSYRNYLAASTIKRALESYQQFILPNGMQYLGSQIDLNTERAIAGSQAKDATVKAQIWGTAYEDFLIIGNKLGNIMPQPMPQPVVQQPQQIIPNYQYQPNQMIQPKVMQGYPQQVQPPMQYEPLVPEPDYSTVDPMYVLSNLKCFKKSDFYDL